ncbi:MAG: hypothetical protein H0V18_09765 [Pyrinomonadaceae bacterium]|nr:hypothetical protein [Pyrinomonadaceae bacterium]
MEGRGGSAVGGNGAGAAGAEGIIGAGAIVAHPPASSDVAMHSVRKPFIARSRDRATAPVRRSERGALERRKTRAKAHRW